MTKRTPTDGFFARFLATTTGGYSAACGTPGPLFPGAAAAFLTRFRRVGLADDATPRAPPAAQAPYRALQVVAQHQRARGHEEGQERREGEAEDDGGRELPPPLGRRGADLNGAREEIDVGGQHHRHQPPGSW